MKSETYLEMFFEGKIRISTLEACRKYENQEMGDELEANETYKITHMSEKDPNLKKKSARLGLHGLCCTNLSVKGFSAI